MDDWLQRLDELQASLLRCVKQGARQQGVAWRNLTERLLRVRLGVLLGQKREAFLQARQRLHDQARLHLEKRRNRWDTLAARLRLLGPEQVLSRGYSITTDAASGKVLRAAREVKAGQRLRTRLKTGEVFSQAEQ